MSWHKRKKCRQLCPKVMFSALYTCSMFYTAVGVGNHEGNFSVARNIFRISPAPRFKREDLWTNVAVYHCMFVGAWEVIQLSLRRPR